MSKMRFTWNKVMLEGEWWPVYPDWIMQTASKGGEIIHKFSEIWFLTPPEVFVLKCYPDNSADQMLPVSRQIKSERKFLKLPVLSYYFFQHNLKLTSEESSLLDTDSGKCVISFKTDSAAAKRLVFFPKFALPEGRGGETHYDPNRLVFCSRRKGRFSFEVRCPVLGEYRIQIRGGPIKEVYRNEDYPYVTAKIDCFHLAGEIAQLPIDTGLIGWGHGPMAEEKGLLKPSVKDPKILVKAKLGGSNTKSIPFVFVLKKDVASKFEFDASIHSENPARECEGIYNGTLQERQPGIHDNLQISTPGVLKDV